MSDELLLRRLRIGWHDDDTPIWVSDAMTEAADRIEALTAEYEEAMECNEQFFVDNEFLKKRVEAQAEWRKYEGAWMTAEGKLADADAMIEAQAKDHASNNIRFAEAEHRAKVAEAERDRLREALGKLECKCSSNCDWERDDVCPSWIARAALKGETP